MAIFVLISVKLGIDVKEKYFFLKERLKFAAI